MKLYRNRLDFYQLLFKAKTQKVNPKLNWYENLFATFVGGLGKLLAKILKIKGNTVVWNQQMPIVSKASATNISGVDVTNNNDGSFTLNGTANSTTANYWMLGAYSASDNIVMTYKKGHKYVVNAVGCKYPTNSNQGVMYVRGSGNVETPYMINITDADYNARAIRLMDFTNGKQYDNVKVYPQIFDVTEMFGSTIADEMYSREQTAGEGIAYFRQYFPLPYYSYSTGSLLSFNGTGIKTTKADTTDLDTLSLPISTYFPTGMKSAGSVYDELTPTKAITKVGSVDLGTLNYNAGNRNNDNTGRIFYSTGHSVGGTGCKCARFEQTSSSWESMKVNTIFISLTGTIMMCADYQDTTAFKTAMNGVYLYYELATPTEVSIGPPLNLSYEIEWGGTEQLLPENTSTPTTSPILADIQYPDGERDDQYFTYREITQTNVLLGKSLNTIMGREVEFNREALDILMKGE